MKHHIQHTVRYSRTIKVQQKEVEAFYFIKPEETLTK